MKIHQLLFAALQLGMTSPLLAANAGDAARGAALYQSRCGGCHSLDESRVGPAHRGVVGRKAGGQPGFAYSPALQKSKLIWTEKALDRWLANPEQMIPGQRMFYSIADVGERADVIAYLRSVPLTP